MLTTTSPALASFHTRIIKEVLVKNITREEVIAKTQKIFSQLEQTLKNIENFSPTESVINNNKELLAEATKLKDNLLNRVDEFVLKMNNPPPCSPNIQIKC